MKRRKDNILTGSGFRKFGIKQDLLTAAALILYRLALDTCYFQIVSPGYAYAGFRDERSFSLCILSWILTLAFIPAAVHFAGKAPGRVSEFVVLFFLLIYYFPFTTLVCSGILTARFITMNTLYFLAIIVFQAILSSSEPRGFDFKLPPVINDGIIGGIFLVCALTIISISAVYTGFRLNFDLYKVYDLRKESAAYDIPIAISYIFSMSRKLCNLFLLLALIRKKTGWAAAVFLLQCLSFGIDGMKSVLFTAAITVMLYVSHEFLTKGRSASYKSFIIWGLTGLTAFCSLEKKALGSSLISDILIRRMMFVPVHLGNFYVDFFSTRTPDFFRGSFLRHFGFQTPYPRLTYTIADIYFNKPMMNANNGMLSDAVTNFGTAGIVIMPLLLVLLLRLFDSSSKHLDEKVGILFAFEIAGALTNTFLCTALLTHGILAELLVLILIQSKLMRGKPAPPVKCEV